MADLPYCKAVHSESSFKRRFLAENGESFANLSYAAASQWGRRELLGLAVIPHKVDQLPIVGQFGVPRSQHHSQEMKKFLDQPDIDYATKSEHFLVRNPAIGHSLGQFLVALARFTRVGVTEENQVDESDIETQRRPKRTKLGYDQPDGFDQEEVYVNSSMIQVGSSSPLADGSQETSSSVGYVDRHSHNIRVHTEDETLRLFSCATRHVLYYAAPQDAEIVSQVVELCDFVSQMKVRTPQLGRELSATADKGGLVLKREFNGIYEQTKNYVMLTEGKRVLQCIEDGRPVLTDKCLAQMTCEALAARLADRAGGRDELAHGRVIFAHPTRQYVCFLQFDIPNEYLQNFEADFEKNNDSMPSSFMHVYFSDYTDLSGTAGKFQLTDHVCAVVASATERPRAAS